MTEFTVVVVQRIGGCEVVTGYEFASHEAACFWFGGEGCQLVRAGVREFKVYDCEKAV